MEETDTKKARKAEYNRKYREKKKQNGIAPEVAVEEAPIAPPIEQPKLTPKTKPKKMPIKQPEEDGDDAITLEEYVEYLVNQKKAKKKTSENQTQSSPYSYSSYMLLVPILLPLLKASSEIAMKYLNKPKTVLLEQQQVGVGEPTVSLTQLLPQ